MSRALRVLALALALSGAVVALSACGRDQPASSLVGVETFAPSDREPMPALAGPTLDGAALDLGGFRGRIVVLNAWASWCTPCRTEIPAFVSLANTADPADVAVVGLDVQDEDAAARDFVDDFGMPYPSIVDSDGSLLTTIPGVPPSALPSTVIVDRDGRIAARVIGEADPAQLDAIVDGLVAEGSGAGGSSAGGSTAAAVSGG